MGASFGAPRELVILHEASKQQFAFPQHNGDVFAFTSAVNKQFMHGVPRVVNIKYASQSPVVYYILFINEFSLQYGTAIFDYCMGSAANTEREECGQKRARQRPFVRFSNELSLHSMFILLHRQLEALGSPQEVARNAAHSDQVQFPTFRFISKVY